jgi:hypothetical protein
MAASLLGVVDFEQPQTWPKEAVFTYSNLNRLNAHQTEKVELRTVHDSTTAPIRLDRITSTDASFKSG